MRQLARRLAKLEAKRQRRTSPLKVVLGVFDRPEDEIVGVACGSSRIDRMAGETVGALLDRAKVQGGRTVVWFAYRH